MQFKLSNLSADRPLVEAWGLSTLSNTINDEFEKPFGRNRPPPLVMRCQLLYWIAKVIVR